MENSTYVALSGQFARERQMAVLANNIANLSTAGFKSERLGFKEYLSGSDPENQTSYVATSGNTRDMSQGPLTHTGNPLDVALDGAGFIAVTTAAGAAYTRNGHLQINAQSQLVNTNGDVVQGDGGAPIVIPQGATDITIGTDGSIATRQGKIAKLPVVNFDKPQALVASSNGLYNTDQTPVPVTTTRVMQGTIEESNVSPVLEMTRLMEASHEMGTAKTFADGEHTRLKNAIDRLGKTI